jgi:2-oxoacid:acceptor oxidoreductase gamma subunit (pyruvate/2-ketoisovalerate family)/2-oxoacid:acceptor oxidoreductase delta subunit (pyruvate/2-ketoisovalerate family)
VTSAEVIVYAASEDNLFAACFPYFGFEKKGGPVAAFIRIGESRIREKCQIYQPDCVLIVDPTVVTPQATVFDGLKPGGTVVMNCSRHEDYAFPENAATVGVVDANAIALETLGRILPNTVMLGALAKVTEWVDKDKLAARAETIWGEKNKLALLRGYEAAETVLGGKVRRRPPEAKNAERKSALPGKTPFLCAVGQGLDPVDTGSWKPYPVEIDASKCVKCGTCALFCPVNSVRRENGLFRIDPSYCKGCGVCINECPQKAIAFVQEGVA